MSAETLAMLGVMRIFFGGIIGFILLLFLSQLALALSVNSSAKARCVANPTLFMAGTLIGGIPVAIMYSCIKKKLTRTDTVKPSAAKFWLVMACVLTALSLVAYIAAIALYITGIYSVVGY